jgi:hypothetical protein
MNITLCDKNGRETDFLPMYSPKSKEEADELIEYWLSQKDFKNSVFVMFQNWNNLKDSELRDEQTSFLITHCQDELDCFYQDLLTLIPKKEIDFAFFEFENYQDAFSYCADLKESF